ncbi:MAG: hypothetical protein AAF502_17500 [Bacteroidota bacterium]
MKNGKIFPSSFPILLAFGLLGALFIFSHSYPINENKGPGTEDFLTICNKQRGAHVWGIVDTTDFQPLIDNNLEWITLVSWGYQDDIDSPIVTHHDGDSIRIMDYDAHWVRKIKSVRAAGFKVFFKPHVWLLSPSEGKWRSDIFPANELGWQTWQESYRNFILRYAKVAERAKVEMFCVGMEFWRLSVEKPEFWIKLIEDVREVYSGKITYAANWYHEYEEIKFWDQLDFIGVQAYFPLANTTNPSLREISKGWSKHVRTLESLSKKWDRKILFTEMGYKSTTNSAITPWEWSQNLSDSDRQYSPETQAKCYQAFFNKVWGKDWFDGVHIWVMRIDIAENYHKDNIDFTPLGKPAEVIISKGFERQKSSTGS